MASRYWVGGNGTWNGSNTANWSATSGGGVGATVPTAADDVFFDANSGVGTATMAAGAVCRSLDAAGYTGTLAHPTAFTLNIGDGTAGVNGYALRFSATMIYTIAGGSSAIAYVSTSTTNQLILTAGKAVGSITWNGLGGSWTLADAMTQAGNGSAYQFNVLAGAFSTGNFNITGGQFGMSGTLTRSVSLGSSTINLGSNAGGMSVWNAPTTTNLTFNRGTSNIIIAAVNQNADFGGLTYYDVTFNISGGGGVSMRGANTFRNLTLKASTATRIQIDADQICTLLTTSSQAQNDMGLIHSTNRGVQRTITAGSASISNGFLQDIKIAGAAAPVAASYVGDMGGNAGITFPAAVTRYFAGTQTGNREFRDPNNWSTTSGGTVGALPPLPQDTAVFDGNSNTATGNTIRLNVQCLPTIDFRNLLNNPTIAYDITNGQIYVRGDIRHKAGQTITNGTDIVMSYRGGDSFIQANGVSLLSAIAVEVLGANLFLSDAFITSQRIDVNFGILNALNDVTCQYLASQNSNVRGIRMGNGTWYLTGNNTDIFRVWNNIPVFEPQGSFIYVVDTGANYKGLSLDGMAAWGIGWASTPGDGGGPIRFGAGDKYNGPANFNGPKNVKFYNGTPQQFNGNFNIGGSTVQMSSMTTGTKQPIQLNGAQGANNGTYAAYTDITRVFGQLLAASGRALATNITKNFITNPGFETGNLTGYTILESADAQVAQQYAQAGGYGLRIMNAIAPGGSGFNSGVRSSLTGLTVGQTYTYSAYVKSPDTGVSINMYASVSTTPGTQSNLTLTKDWQRITLTFIASATSGDVVIRSNNSRAVWYADSIQLEQGSVASAYTESQTDSAGLVNLIPNPSFETDLTGWSQYGGSPAASLARSTDFAMAGTASAKVINSSANGGGGYAGGLSLSITNLIVGRVYTISAWIYAPSPMSNIGLYMEQIGNPSVDQAISAGWNRIKLTYTNTQSGFKIYIRSNSLNATWYVDSIQLEEGYSATPYSDTNLIGQTNITKGGLRSMLYRGLAPMARGIRFLGDSSSNITFASATGLSTATTFTIVMRIQGQSNGAEAKFLSARGVVVIGWNTNNTIRFEGNGGGFFFDSPTLNPGQSYLVFCEITPTTIKGWIDNVLVVDQAGGTAGATWPSNWYMALDSGASRPFNGIISGLRVFAGTLSASDRATLYPHGDIATTKLAWYRFNEGTGTTITDSSGNNNNGTLNNGQWVTGGLYKGLSRTLNVTGISAATIKRAINKVLSYNALAAPARKNIITNPSFEVDLTGWSPYACSYARDTTTSYLGGASALVSNAAADGGIYMGVTYRPGRTYTAQMRVKGTAGKVVRLQNNQGTPGSIYSANFTLTGGWDLISWTFTHDQNATGGSLEIKAFDPNQSFNVDAVMVENSSTLNPYFDGSVTGYGWEGTPGLSSSTQNLAPQSRFYRTMTAAGTSLASMTTRSIAYRTLSAAGTATVSMSRRISTTLIAYGTALPALAVRLNVFRTLTAYATGTPIMITGAKRFIVLMASATFSAAIMGRITNFAPARLLRQSEDSITIIRQRGQL